MTRQSDQGRHQGEEPWLSMASVTGVSIHFWVHYKEVLCGIPQPNPPVSAFSVIKFQLQGLLWKNPPSNAGDVGLISDQGLKIPHATGQLSRQVATREPVCCSYRGCVLESPRTPTREPVHRNSRKARVPQQRPSTVKKKIQLLADHSIN